MSNPTLTTQVTPYTGWTLATAVETLLATRGLSEDSTSGRTIATATESADARRRIRRAVADLHLSFPGIYSDRTYTIAAWTVGDHSAQLPSDFGSIRWVEWGGVPLVPLDDEARLRDLTSVAGGRSATDQIQSTSRVRYYRVEGVDSTNSIPVIRLYEQPTEAEECKIRYISRAPQLTTDASVLPYDPVIQEWIISKARALWAADEPDQIIMAAADKGMRESADKVDTLQQGSHEKRSAFRWKFPAPGARYPRY